MSEDAENFFEFLRNLMGQAQPDLKVSDMDCNCPWMGCSEHKESLCPHKANYVVCENKDCPEHFLGDKSLAEGIHLCVKCSNALLSLVGDDIPNLMNELHSYVPEWMKPLEALVNDAYTAKRQGGWMQPQNDAMAVLGLASCIVKADEGKKIPAKELETLLRLLQEVRSVILAYGSVSMKVEDVKL